VHPFVLSTPVRDGAARYRLRLADSAGHRITLLGEEPAFDLAPAWGALAPGFVRYNLSSHDSDGVPSAVGEAGQFLKGRPIARAAQPPPAMDWHAASRAHFRYLSSLPTVVERGEQVPLWLRHAWTRPESGRLAPVAYPGLHYPFHLWSLLRYRELEPASLNATRPMIASLVTSALAWRTPEDWAWSSYPRSTIGQEQDPAAAETAGVLQPLKAAVLALALLDLPGDELTPDARALALHVGEQLATHQRDDGALPFRVDGRSGEWLSGESSAAIFAVNLWRRLASALRSGCFDACERRALDWLLRGPVSDRRWIGNFEDVATSVSDVASKSPNIDNYDAIVTALTLVEDASATPGMIEHALAIHDWVDDEFTFAVPEPPVESLGFIGPAVMEQSLHYYPIDFHAANLARLKWALFDATGEHRYREEATAILDALTHHFDALGRPLTYAPDPDVGYGYSDVVWFGCAALAWLALSEGALRLRGERAGSEPPAGGRLAAASGNGRRGRGAEVTGQ
jgi:hypothetical protein